MTSINWNELILAISFTVTGWVACHVWHLRPRPRWVRVYCEWCHRYLNDYRVHGKDVRNSVFIKVQPFGLECDDCIKNLRRPSSFSRNV